MKKFIVLVINLLLVIALLGCGANNKTPYIYDNDKVMDEVTIKKSVFTDEKLIIYISELGECLSLEAYDANFNCLENDFDYEYKNGKLIIKGKGAEEISGLKIKSSSYQEIKLRYLDSNQYAILIDYCEVEFGTVTHGDRDAYELEILDSDCYGFCFQFDLNEDKTAIMDWSIKEAGFIKSEGVLPDDLTLN